MLTGKAPESFLVRLWLQVREIAGAPSELRGHVEHLGSGRREYVTSFGAIEEFMAKVVGASAKDER